MLLSSRTKQISKVGDKWPELLPELAEVLPPVFEKVLPILCAQIHSTRTKPAERVRLVQMLEDLLSSDLFDPEDTNPTKRTLDGDSELWKAFVKLFNDDDLKVREGKFKSLF